MRSVRFLILALLVTAATGSFGIVSAQEAVDDGTLAAEINTLQEEIAAKQANIDQLNRRIESYRDKIEQTQNTAASLSVEVELLENRVAKTELDIEANQAEIDVVNGEIQILNHQLQTLEDQLTRERAMLSEILQKIQGYDDDFSLQLLFGTDSFSELFDRLQLLENVNDDLSQSLQRAEAAKEQVHLVRTQQEGKRERLLTLQDALERNKRLLEEEKGAKVALLAESQNSESEYRSMLYSVRQESAFVDQQIAALQGEIEAKLSANDTLGDSSVLSWPVDPTYKGLSTTFHDKTYPFRHLFEHSGIDVPQPQGTPVTSAAPGYVAWTRTASMYGNYVMIIHTDGIATLYAHLSKISVVQDQFIGRGDTIGLSGGMPGTAGAGLSTGPHLHFEVRKDGIPTDPLNYLVSY